MNHPRVSVVILTWNGLDLLKTFLPSVAATTYPNLELIVADNGSTDGSTAWVEATFPEIITVQHPENWGFCKGYNEALSAATGDYLVLLNNDVEVPPDWLEPLIQRMEHEPDIGAVQPKLLRYDRRDWFEYAGGAGGFLDRFGYPFTRGRVLFTLEPDEGQYDEPRDLLWATGAALVLRRSAIDEVGLLDERFVLHMEEIDLCWRLNRHGWRVVAEPASVVYHMGGATLPQGSPRKTYYNFRNSLLMLYKNLAPPTWRRVFMARLILDGLAVGRALFMFDFQAVQAIFRAHRDAHRMKSSYADERPRSEAETSPLPYRRSILWDYFVRRRTTFKALPASKFVSPVRSSAPVSALVEKWP